MTTHTALELEEMKEKVRLLPPDERIDAVGHRSYIGGHDPETWYAIGRLQYHYLVSKGLRPNHVFLDVACGSLRLGQYLIPYLETGNYFGLEGEEKLVQAGLEHEFEAGIIELKQPRFAINYDFDVTALGSYDFAMAQSLITHLTPDDTRLCLTKLRTSSKPSSTLIFTYVEGDSAKNPDTPSHANRLWVYSAAEIRAFAESAGWSIAEIEEWNHPRNQLAVIAHPA